MNDKFATDNGWTNEELALIRLKNMANWDVDDFIFYGEINKELLEIINCSDIQKSKDLESDSKLKRSTVFPPLLLKKRRVKNH